MKQIVMFIVLYLAFWLVQRLFEILIDWLRHVTEYHIGQMSLKLAEKEQQLKKIYDEGDEDLPSTSCVGFQYTPPEEDDDVMDE